MTEQSAPDQARQRREQRVWTIIGLVIAVGLIVVAAVRAANDGADLVWYHDASVHWLQTGDFSPDQFYLPAFIILMTPLVAWPLPVAGVLMGVLNVVLFVLILRMLVRHVAPEPDTSFATRWVWPTFLMLALVADTILLGQVNLIVLWLCLLSYFDVVRGREIRGGCIIGLAAIVKIVPLIFTVFWLIKGRWKTALAAWVTAGVLAAGLSIGGYGWQQSVEAHRDWRRTVKGVQYQPPPDERAAQAPTGLVDRLLSGDHLAFTQKWNQFHRHNNQALPVVIRRLTTDLFPDEPSEENIALLHLSIRDARIIYSVLAAGVLLTLVIVAWRRRSAPVTLAEWSAWLVSVVAFVPIYWTHHFMFLAPAVIVLVFALRRRRRAGESILFERILLIAWLIGIAAMGIDLLRLAGFHCWLALAFMVWALRYREPLAPELALR